jgi:hypothetical protein
MLARSPPRKQRWFLPSAISWRWGHLIETAAAELVEVARLGAGEIEYLTHVPDIRALGRDVGTSLDSIDLLAWRIWQIDFDPDELAGLEPQLMRDLLKVCTTCGCGRKCKRDLMERPRDEAWLGYCPNAPTLAALIAERARLSPFTDWCAGPDP